MLTIHQRARPVVNDVIDVDTEFLAHGTTVRLASVGMVRQSDGAKLYLLTHDWRDIKASAKEVDPWVYENVFDDRVVFGAPDPIQSKNPEETRERILEFVGDYPKLWFYVQGMDKILLDLAIGGLSKAPKTWPYTGLDLAVILRMSGVDKDAEYPKQQMGNHLPEHCAMTDAIWQRYVRQGVLSRAADGEFGTISQSILDYADHIPR